MERWKNISLWISSGLDRFKKIPIKKKEKIRIFILICSNHRNPEAKKEY
ncbi:MAG: hypothetical protein KAW82_00665 [Desulfurellaceae bacterium]|nr:hypothetical protein [Desulfurellaceae bacterium]